MNRIFRVPEKQVRGNRLVESTNDIFLVVVEAEQSQEELGAAGFFFPQTGIIHD